MNVKLNSKFVVSIDQDSLVDKYENKISDIFQSVQSNSADGVEMTGWLKWIFKDHSEFFKSAKEIREQWLKAGVKTIIVIGTGGSYIGAKAGIDFLNEQFQNRHFEFVFVPSFSEKFCGAVLKKIKNEKFAIVVISKSGTTLESAVAFRLFREELVKKENEKYYQYVIAVTDKSKGTLRTLSVENKFHVFEIEDNIGGRYSALTAVGLVPMILNGIVVEEVMSGAFKCYEDHYHLDIKKNGPALYAAYRHHFFEEDGLRVECLNSYDPQLGFCLEKMKQLFAESEGKNLKGLFPVPMNFTPDLHSVGQLMQDGFKSFFETTVMVEEFSNDIVIKKSSFGNDDGLDWLEGKNLKFINNAAFQGTVSAHSESSKVNNLVLELKDWTPFTFGYFYFYLCLAAMFSAYLFEVNPFDQPGVEDYKKRMFEILKK